MTKEMILENGIYVCPKCHQRKFKLMPGSGGFHTHIVNYDMAPAEKRNIGRFKFVYVCENCGIKLIEYANI